MSESPIRAATKAELKIQEKTLGILREQMARGEVTPPQVNPPLAPPAVHHPPEKVKLKQVAEKVFRGTGEFNLPHLPNGIPVDKFFQELNQRMSFKRRDMRERAAQKGIEQQLAREKTAAVRYTIEQKREQNKEPSPEQRHRPERERERKEREQKWFDNQRSEVNCCRFREQKSDTGENFTAF